MEVASSMNYRGSFFDVKDAVNSGLFNDGDVISVGCDTYVYAQGSFEEIGRVDNTDDRICDSRSLTELKCTSCGAPLMISKYSSHIKCEYCGTTYCIK